MAVDLKVRAPKSIDNQPAGKCDHCGHACGHGGSSRDTTNDSMAVETIKKLWWGFTDPRQYPSFAEQLGVAAAVTAIAGVGSLVSRITGTSQTYLGAKTIGLLSMGAVAAYSIWKSTPALSHSAEATELRKKVGVQSRVALEISALIDPMLSEQEIDLDKVATNKKVEMALRNKDTEIAHLEALLRQLTSQRPAAPQGRRGPPAAPGHI